MRMRHHARCTLRHRSDQSHSGGGLLEPGKAGTCCTGVEEPISRMGSARTCLSIVGAPGGPPPVRPSISPPSLGCSVRAGRPFDGVVASDRPSPGSTPSSVRPFALCVPPSVPPPPPGGGEKGDGIARTFVRKPNLYSAKTTGHCSADWGVRRILVGMVLQIICAHP